ncbi:1-phosphatidylinositol phosphodiesterase-like isoform X2 [Alosa alosa]|nr:1-phosphatidylinositol phosphodiesterase-like isoform X2 [Alosa alosa]XP_048116845.1 1-phosphatidylinositol phosphodiesterase-like isoform X2 [Alosa alosa]XP_048116846.1 1-phosphatidylinositol phosphodiesterase-like isoform X2 [Alosa alosa]
MKSSFLQTALFALLLVAFQDLSRSQKDQSFNDAADLNLPEPYDIGWMKSIDNNKFISDITVPGTHDTMALHWGSFVECQAWSLETQLKAGIRYLDLRVKMWNKELKLVHGYFSQHITLPEVLSIIQTFLKDYVSEAILVRVKLENVTQKQDAKNLIESFLKDNPDIETWDKSNVPSMGDVRGKIVFIQKEEFTLGIPIHGTDASEDYKVRKIDEKKEKIKNHLKKAGEMCGNGEVILTYSSGTGLPNMALTLTPKVIAQKINPWLNEYLNHDNLKNIPCFGVIAMDFPGFDLIKRVIGLNKLKPVVLGRVGSNLSPNFKDS